ncbi:MAG: YHS domain-containing protein [Deltaproteobacteria bacterium]|nr:YHS domain-containing protein [Deltaproteobacteria bacterium]MBI4794848.1 YHS domain-containing protein [Deltaproteobacteria bacterium]
MKRIKLVMLPLMLTLFLAGPVLAAATPQPQTTCPVLGGKINKEFYADYKGQRVYFCCSGCDVEFKKDPEKYLQKMKEQGITPEKSPAAK